MIYKYVRFSTSKQDEQQQDNMIEKYLASHGMTADDTITDAGISGGVAYEKRQLGMLCKSLKPNDVIVVAEISRITRSGIAELSEIIEKHFKPNRLRLVICNVGLDIDCSDINPMMELQLAMMATFAKIEKSLIQERTRNALDARKKLIEKDGGFVSKSGKWCTKLGNGGKSIYEAAQASANKRKKEAREDDSNIFFYKYWKSYEKRNEGASHDKEYYERLAEELNSLGQRTKRGCEYNVVNVQTYIVRSRKRYENE